jgi:hypothetical protein
LLTVFAEKLAADGIGKVVLVLHGFTNGTLTALVLRAFVRARVARRDDAHERLVVTKFLISTRIEIHSANSAS